MSRRAPACHDGALLTAMDSPLGSAAGNAVEVAYAIDYLTGRRREARMHEVTVALGAEMLLLGRLATDLDDARRKIDAAITGGRAAEIFQRMVSALGGPSDLVERPGQDISAPRPSSPPCRRRRTASSLPSIRGRSASPSWRSAAAGRARQDPVDRLSAHRPAARRGGRGQGPAARHGPCADA